ncbi:MAG TPA: hypothetical protein VHN79_11620, partial [Lacunisphaera sp.]|nr:hypothetical protein [Lacunisphaera sp.]
GELAGILAANACGRAYRAGDPASLAAELQWFADHRGEAAEMGLRSRQLFNARFDAKKIYEDFAQHIEEIYREFHHG